ncbi:ROK family protein [Stomatohabitans albus]|uniref:ROK family protein n=1 Tax=Stomatohabitans albus TaxID=3110766 RepID=UPI00300C04B9
MNVIGIDVGGTKIAAATVNESGEIGPIVSVPTPGQEGPDAMLDAFARVANDAAQASGIAIADVPAIGVGTAGVVNTDTGTILQSTSVLKDWAGTAVANGLAARFPHAPKVVVQNDVDAHAMGEVWKGIAAGYETVLMVAPGTGVGACLLINGVPVRGAHHVGGEIGHLPIGGADDMPCTCGKFGHLESLAAGPALHRWYVGHGGNLSSPDAKDVVARANEGEAVAIRAVQTAGAALGRGMAAIVTVVDPQCVVLSGGLAQAGELWWNAMESAFRGELIEPLQDTPVLLGQLAGAAPILGSAKMAFDTLNA